MLVRFRSFSPITVVPVDWFVSVRRCCCCCCCFVVALLLCCCVAWTRICIEDTTQPYIDYLLLLCHSIVLWIEHVRRSICFIKDLQTNVYKWRRISVASNSSRLCAITARLCRRWGYGLLLSSLPPSSLCLQSTTETYTRVHCVRVGIYTSPIPYTTHYPSSISPLRFSLFFYAFFSLSLSLPRAPARWLARSLAHLLTLSLLSCVNVCACLVCIRRKEAEKKNPPYSFHRSDRVDRTVSQSHWAWRLRLFFFYTNCT